MRTRNGELCFAPSAKGNGGDCVARMCLAFAILPAIMVLAGCWSGVNPILEDYNSRFAVDSAAAQASPALWKEVTVRGVQYMNVRSGTYAPSPSDLTAQGYPPGTLPADMKWYIKTPKEVVPEQTVDVTCYYDPAAGCLKLPPAAALGLTLVTFSLSGSPNAGQFYQLIGEGMQDDGTGLRILSSISTAPN